MQRDLETLADMIHACEALARVRPSNGFAEFQENETVRYAVMHQFMILGEASKRLSSAIKEKNPTIPWREISGMRDKLIHQYDGVDLVEVWNTLDKDIPELLIKLKLLGL
jgi:uncharacterized protein with HEPN domain